MTKPFLRNLTCAFTAVALLAGVHFAFAQDAVEDGREALRGDVDFPWYDAENDDLRPVELPKPDEPEPEEEPEVDFDTGSVNLSGGSGGILLGLFWVVIIALFVGLVVLLVWAFLRHDRPDTPDDDSTRVVGSSSDVDRIEQLPFTVRQPQGDLLEEARRCYERGDYGEAIIYLYSYKLVQLDKHHLIHLSKGKTNRQYLREVRPQARVVPLLERTMIAFEDVFFGNHKLDRERFEACWSGLGEFHQLVQGTAA